MWPFKVRSRGGALYFVTFIDDPSRKFWVIFLFVLKFKDQELNVFEDFWTLIERQIEKKLKCIRSDNDGDYIGPFNNIT